MSLSNRGTGPSRRRAAPDDSADATQLLRIGAPIACPTCGSHTRPTDTPEGWACLDAQCVWSS